MRFLFVSPTGDSIGIALRVALEGNDVAFWCLEPMARHVGEGLVSIFGKDSFSPGKGDIIVFDMTGQGALADMLRWDGHHVIGGSGLADRLEDDRDYAFGVMKKCKIRIPNYETFTDWESGKEFAASLGEKAVFKPSGDIAEQCSSMVLEANELVDVLDKFSSQFSKDSQFEIQEFIEGVDLSTEGWFNGEEFVEPFNHTLETKKFMNDDKGPSEGCTGNVVWATTADDPLVQETILKLTPFLRSNSYIGPIDVNVIVSKDGPYALEFTPRFGYDATPTLAYELLGGDVGGFLWTVATKAKPFFDVKEGFAAGLRMSIPPWPNQKYEAQQGIAINGLHGSDYDHFCPMNVMEQDGQLATAGAWGILGVLTGYGKTIQEAFDTPYKIAKRMEVPQKQYRTDMADYFTKRYRKIQSEVMV